MLGLAEEFSHTCYVDPIRYDNYNNFPTNVIVAKFKKNIF